MIVFVYGTLTDHDRADELLDSFSYGAPATLVGLHRVDGRYPTLAPGSSVEGRLLHTDEIGTLDAYEGVDDGLYVRVSVPVESDDPDAPESAAVYVGDPGRLAAPADWPGGPFPDCVDAHLAANTVRIRIK